MSNIIANFEIHGNVDAIDRRLDAWNAVKIKHERMEKALENISIFCGWDPYHVGAEDYNDPVIKLLTEMIETLRDEAKEALK